MGVESSGSVPRHAEYFLVMGVRTALLEVCKKQLKTAKDYGINLFLKQPSKLENKIRTKNHEKSLPINPLRRKSKKPSCPGV